MSITGYQAVKLDDKGKTAYGFRCTICDFTSSFFEFNSYALRNFSKHCETILHQRNVQSKIVSNEASQIQEVIVFMNQNNILDYATAKAKYDEMLVKKEEENHIELQTKKDNEFNYEADKKDTKNFIRACITGLRDYEKQIQFIKDETGYDLTEFIGNEIELVWLYTDNYEDLNQNTLEYKISYVINIILGFVDNDDVFDHRQFKCCCVCSCSDEVDKARLMQERNIAKHDLPPRIDEYNKWYKLRIFCRHIRETANHLVEFLKKYFNDTKKSRYDLETDNNNFLVSITHRPSKRSENFMNIWKPCVMPSDYKEESTESDE